MQLDVGTNNEALLSDPMYLGWRNKRISGKEYDDFIGDFVAAVKKKFPHVFLHWEDFGRSTARRNLYRYKDEMCTFNDDVQGTGAVALAAILAGINASGIALENHRIVIFGAGTAGVGIADQLFEYMRANSMSEQAARDAFYLIDKDGLLTDESLNVMNFHKPYLKETAKVGHLASLGAVVDAIKPTVLIGCSTVGGAFSETVIRSMAEHTPHPIVMPLSNPTRKAEATPANILNWSEGRALVATGSPFDPVYFGEKMQRISQCNNAFIFPGLGLGVIATRATRITDNMLRAACDALVELSPAKENKGAPLLPEIQEIKKVSLHIAHAVAKQAQSDGVAGIPANANLDTAITEHMWEPIYFPYKNVDHIDHE